VNLPGANVGVPNPVPGITSQLPKPPGLPGGGSGGSGHGTHGSKGGVDYTPPGLTVPEEVMPHAVNYGGAGGRRYQAPGSLPAKTVGGHIVAAPAKVTATAAQPADPSNVANAGLAKSEGLGSNSDGGLFGKQLPVVLAIAAILALSLVTAGYARMMLLRRH
jgi:hypothetical protein